MKTGYIYKITSPSGKIYIGQTLNIKKRINSYKSNSCNRQFKLYNSLIKYSWNNHIIEIIEDCDYNIIDEKEIYWIEYYDSYNNGLNLTIGGKGKNGMTYSNKKNISKANKGKIAWNKGLTGIYSKETLEKISQKSKGKIPWNKGLKDVYSEETLFKISNSRKGKPGYWKGKTINEEQRKKISNSTKNKIRIMCIETGIIFESIREASEILGIGYSALKKHLSGNTKSSGGFTFSKVDYPSM